MNSNQSLIFWTVFALTLVVGVHTLQADPMTGGNPPYEDCAPPCAVSCYIPPVRCPWYFQVDGIAMKRDVQNGSAVFATFGQMPPAGTNPVDVTLSNRDLVSPFKGGGRLLLGHTFGDTPYQLEVSYFAIDQWDSSASLLDNSPNPFGASGRLFSRITNFGNPPQSPYDYSSFVSVENISRLQNFELNAKYLLPMKPNGMNASFLVGVRYMEIDEKFLYNSRTNVQLLPAPPVVTATTNFLTTTDTTNTLVGPQIGGYFEFYSIYNSWISFQMKGALCGNQAGNVTDKGISLLEPRQDQFTTAFVGDLELMFNWRITPHCVTRFGYQAIWVDGLAIATRNFDQTAGVHNNANAIIDTSGNVVYHGPHLGLEITW